MTNQLRVPAISALTLLIIAISSGCDDSSSSTDSSGDDSTEDTSSGSGSDGGGTTIVGTDDNCPVLNEGDTLEVGDVGPAGGWIFYVKSNDDDGWTYLEAAPEDISFSTAGSTNLLFSWGTTYAPELVVVNNTSEVIGSGKTNTDLIIDAFEDAGLTGRAAQRAADYDHEDCEWFLPSRQELEKMRTELHVNGLGDFESGTYWSSSESLDIQRAWANLFIFAMEQEQLKGTANRVRPVRRF